ncbi:hypothetical protein F52700_13606 [Fusarium sp. NRRL 52700]|nr:hypothetical protein F52700_13606 [Fusarium sp. NRRL 52700]
MDWSKFAADCTPKPYGQSTTITIRNKLSETLTLQSSNLGQGYWAQPDSSLGILALPQPASINAGEEAIFMAKGEGDDLSNNGSLVYTASVGTFTVTFNNPNDAANSYSESSPSGYMIGRSGGSGDNASVKWVVESNGRALSDLGGAVENLATAAENAAENVAEAVVSADLSANSQATPGSGA